MHQGEIFFRQCILQLLGREPPSLSKKKMYVSTIFTILQHREPASLKTFPAPLGALKRKRVRLEARGRFSTLYFYTGGLDERAFLCEVHVCCDGRRFLWICRVNLHLLGIFGNVKGWLPERPPYIWQHIIISCEP